jgi:hypothetical protein
MNATPPQSPFIVPVDDEHAEMLAYALSAEGQEKIARAQAEIDAGEGLVADGAYFESLRERRSRYALLADACGGSSSPLRSTPNSSRYRFR